MLPTPLHSGMSRRWPVLMALAFLLPASAQQEAPQPLVVPVLEQETVSRVQIDVSVIDPRGDDWASVRGISKDAFKIKLDGRRIEGELLERVEFDEICGSPPSTGEGFLADERATIIAFVDLNFLVPSMRHLVVKSLDELADKAQVESLRVKVLAFTRRIVPLTDGFTSDPEEIRRAARQLDGTLFFPHPMGTVEGLPGGELASARDMLTSSEPTPGFVGSDAPDPVSPDPALEITPPGGNPLRTLQERISDLPVAPEMTLATMEVDPRPSLAALEAVLVAHGSIHGRKALVLFSSGWFDLPDELWVNHAGDTLQAAQRGFTIWTVDSRGLTGQRSISNNSRLMSHLASATGGQSIHAAGRLSIAFDRAVAQLSCYYLFSIPVQPPRKGSKRHTVTVDLDTHKHPEYWRLRVRSPGVITLLGAEKARVRRRLAALIEPDAHSFPEVRVTAAYPRQADKKFELPVEVSVLLADLYFQQVPQQKGHLARIAWTGAVEDLRSRVVCQLGDGIERLIRTPSPPTRSPPSMLVLSSNCLLPDPGMYIIRVVVEDLQTGDVGASSAVISVPVPSERTAGVSSLRLGRNSGRDFLFLPGPGKSVEIPRDARRRAFVPLRKLETVDSTDRIVLRFVACGKLGPPRVVLYKPGEQPRSMYQLLLSSRYAMRQAQWSCQEYEAVIPERTLDPGRYGVAIFERSRRIDSREQVDQLLEENSWDGSVGFEVRPALAPPPRDPESDV